jgi:hypothetical protein
VPPDALSRRSFIALGGGVVLLAACGGNDDAESEPSQASGEVEFTEISAGVVSSDLHVSDGPQRFAFAALAKEGFASGKPARVALAPPGTQEIAPSELQPATLRAEGLPENRGVYTLDSSFDRAGTWVGIMEYDSEVSDFVFRVKQDAEAPAVGGAAVSTPTATVDAPLGVDPICTLDPQCPLHGKSLDTVIGAGKPVAVMFSTPARCATQYCGPTLETFLTVTPDFESRVELVHVEIYPDATSPDVVDAVAAWGLPSEPWLFGIDAAGTVTSRLDGAFDASEMRELLSSLT